MNHPAPTAADPFDARAFRDALGCFPTGVAVITTVHEGKPVGLTCNSFSSVSLDPPLVLWSLRRESRALEAFHQGPGFAINILAEDQSALSGHFASRVEDKFAGTAWHPGLRGLPLLDSCLTRFECSRFAQHEAGDHVIFIGQVERFEQPRGQGRDRDNDPLVFSRGAYMMLNESLREMAAKGRIDAQELAESRGLVFSMLLRLAVRNGSEEDFNALDASIELVNSLNTPEEKNARAAAVVRFLELIAQAAHNEVLATVARTLTTMLLHNATAAAGTSPTQRAGLAQVRADMLAALRRRDEDAALAAWGRYIEWVRPDNIPVAKQAAA